MVGATVSASCTTTRTQRTGMLAKCCRPFALGRFAQSSVRSYATGMIVNSRPGVRATQLQVATVQAPSSVEPAPTPNRATNLTPSPVVKTAEHDAQNFTLHTSVEFWRTFGSAMTSPMWANSDAGGGSDQLTNLQRQLERVYNSGATSDPQAAAYWAYHAARLSFFVSQAAAGLVSHHLFENSGAVAKPDNGAVTPLSRMAKGGQQELYTRSAEAVAMWLQDYQNITAGLYQLPWDMTTIGNKQYNPLFILRRTVSFMREATNTLRRRTREKADNLWMTSGMYPEYFLKSFHFQTDGWLSSKSAAVYEHSTETMFFGRQDAMQRASLMPIARHLVGKDVSSMKLLEIACGTGRFHTFIKDNYPDLPSVASDLSPFYLQQARANMKEWKRLRQPNKWLGGSDDTGVTFLQTAAESISAPDSSYDVVVSVYLFHELPQDVRKKVVGEMFRVLKPGGLCVLTDSVQVGDRPIWDESITKFTSFNEPYYESYVNCNFGAMFKEAGFQCGDKYMASATKTLSFIKPLEADTPTSSSNSSRNSSGDSSSSYMDITRANLGAEGSSGVDITTRVDMASLN